MDSVGAYKLKLIAGLCRVEHLAHVKGLVPNERVTLRQECSQPALGKPKHQLVAILLPVRTQQDSHAAWRYLRTHCRIRSGVLLNQFPPVRLRKGLPSTSIAIRHTELRTMPIVKSLAS